MIAALGSILGAIGAIFGAVGKLVNFLTLLAFRKAGKDAARAEMAEAAAKLRRKAHEVRNHVRHDPGERKRLRDKYRARR